MTLAPRQLVLLVLLTLTWGINWPVMKIGVTEYPPLAFRALSIWLGLPFVYIAARVMGQSLRIERRDDGRFHKVMRVRTSRSGRYRVGLSRPGVYRVRYGAVTGPLVRVR